MYHQYLFLGYHFLFGCLLLSFGKNILSSLCLHLPFHPPTIPSCCEMSSYDRQIWTHWWHLITFEIKHGLQSPSWSNVYVPPHLHNFPVQFQTPPFTKLRHTLTLPYSVNLWAFAAIGFGWKCSVSLSEGILQCSSPSLRLNVIASKSHFSLRKALTSFLALFPWRRMGANMTTLCHAYASLNQAPDCFHLGIASSWTSAWNVTDSVNVCSMN